MAKGPEPSLGMTEWTGSFSLERVTHVTTFQKHQALAPEKGTVFPLCCSTGGP